MSPFGLVVRFTLRPGGAEQFDALAREAVTGIAAHEPRTLAYAVHTVEGEPDLRVFYELYADEDAWREHEGQPTTRSFLDSVQAHVLGAEVQRLHLSTGTGLAETPGAGPAR